MPNDPERYQLRDKCLFVDAYVYDEKTKKPSGSKKPDAIQGPHVLDQSTDPATYLLIDDASAFIARFIVMGVDLKFIPQILQSEYPGVGANFAGQVAAVYNILAPYLEKRSYQRPYGAPKKPDPAQPHLAKGYTLDFSVNWFGTGGLLKGPL